MGAIPNFVYSGVPYLRIGIISLKCILVSVDR